MIDVALFILSLAIQSGGGQSSPEQMTAQSAATAPSTADVTAAPKPAMPETSYQAEPQTPTGKFTTATEIKPIMSATKMNWLALREYEGQDLLYVTQIWAWRCGLAGMRLGLNGGALTDIPLPACHSNTAAPNAITGEDGLPYFSFALGSVDRIDIEIIYDDLTRDSASFQRNAILMP